MSSECRDVIKEGDNAPFVVERYAISGGTISGQEPNSGVVWNNCPASALDTASNRGHISISLPINSFYVPQLLKRTNPSRPSVDLGVALVELRELPRTIKDLGDLRWSKLQEFLKENKTTYRRLKKVAKVNLLVQFGLMPLFSDLEKLCIFQKYVDQRMKEIAKLKTRGLRRTIELGRESDTQSDTYTLQSNRLFLTGKRTRVTSVTIRGHIRWYVTDGFNQYTDEQLRRRVIRIVSGEVVDFSTVWETLPWSWLLDWFTNLGDQVASRRNLLNAHHDTPRIMRYTKTVTQTTCNPPPGISFKTIDSVVEHKTRSLSAALTSAQLPILSAKQLSILGSLSISRR